MTDAALQVRSLPGELTETSYRLDITVEYEEWERIGQTLLALARSSLWWLGDWLRFGEATYGESYAQAMDLTGLGYQAVKDVVWTCEHVPVEVRNETVPFWHHKEVAALDVAAQSELVAACAVEGWTRSELRGEVRKRRALVESHENDPGAEGATEGPEERREPVRERPRDTEALASGDAQAFQCSWCGAYLEVAGDVKQRDLGPCPVPHPDHDSSWWAQGPPDPPSYGTPPESNLAKE